MKVDIPEGWKKYWIYNMFERYWFVQKDGGLDSRTSAKYLYDTVTGEYTLLRGHYMNAACVLAGHLLLAEY